MARPARMARREQWNLRVIGDGSPILPTAYDLRMTPMLNRYTLSIGVASLVERRGTHGEARGVRR